MADELYALHADGPFLRVSNGMGGGWSVSLDDVPLQLEDGTALAVGGVTRDEAIARAVEVLEHAVEILQAPAPGGVR